MVALLTSTTPTWLLESTGSTQNSGGVPWAKSPGIHLRFPPSKQEPESPQRPKGLQRASLLNPFDAIIPLDLIFSTPNGNPMETGRRTKILQKRLRESKWTAPSHRNWPWHVRQRRAEGLLPRLRVMSSIPIKM